MRIKETVERDCCQRIDLFPVFGTRYINTSPKYVFCKHCGQHHIVDPIDHVYLKLKQPWELEQ